MLTMLNVIDYGMDIQEAVDAPRIHQQWLPDHTLVETRALSADTRAILESMGHKLAPPQPENHVAAILIGAPAKDAQPVGANRFYGAIDPRRDTGLALGY
jgi:gamma-glutamyltranspeptidase/glutathione hydrolase